MKINGEKLPEIGNKCDNQLKKNCESSQENWCKKL